MAHSPSPGACTQDSDCALAPADADWCVAARTCDPTFGQCITWPRCVSDPWLGCLRDAQRCVNARLLAATTHESDAALIGAVAVLVIGILATVIGLLVHRAAQRWQRPARVVADSVL